MKKTQHFLLAWLLCCAVSANPLVLLSGGTPVAGGLILWQEQSLDDDYFDGSAAQIISQEIQGATKNVKEVVFVLYTTAGTASAKIQLRTAANGGGSQIGADSDTLTIDTNQVERTFTFATAVGVSTDFVINIVGVSGSWRARIRLGSNAYGGTTYAGWQGASRLSTWDLRFKIYTE